MLTVKPDRLGLGPGTRVLDLGCGKGRHLHAFYYTQKIYGVGVDLTFEDVRATRQGFEQVPDFSPDEGQGFALAVADATRLPFSSASFDSVICSEVLEHIPDYRGAVAEIARVLKPGGALALSVPRFWPEWICWRLAPGYHLTPGGHIRIFRARRLKDDVTAQGFRYTGTHYAHGLHSPYWWLQCLRWSTRERSRLVKLYHRFLVWDIMKRPWLTRALGALADPLMGKSIVLYFLKGQATS